MKEGIVLLSAALLLIGLIIFGDSISKEKQIKCVEKIGIESCEKIWNR